MNAAYNENMYFSYVLGTLSKILWLRSVVLGIYLTNLLKYKKRTHNE